MTAESVRHWAEGMAEGTYMEGDLNGMCAKASAELWRQLAAIGIKAEIRVWVCQKDGQSTHVFLAVGDYVLDVTATQFRKLRNFPVYFEHEKEAEVWEWYQHTYVFDSPAALVAWQKEVSFVCEQIAEV